MSACPAISLRDWQMGLGPFAIHVIALTAFAVGFAITNHVWAALAALVLLVALPISQSMRLRRLGRKSSWVLLPWAGLLALLYQVFSALSAVSGAPDGRQTPGEKLAETVGLIGLRVMALITVFCLIPDRLIARPNPEPSR